MPPCAHLVEPSSSSDLVISRMLLSGRALCVLSAAVTPAMPEPTTTTSARLTQPGGGASSRCAIIGPAPHGGPILTAVLSISLVLPTVAATSSSARPVKPTGTCVNVSGSARAR